MTLTTLSPQDRAVIDEAVRWQMVRLGKGVRYHINMARFGQPTHPHPFYKKRSRRGYKTKVSR